jgi:hypothetical protein
MTDMTSRMLPSPAAPMEVARAMVAEQHTAKGGEVTLRHWRGGWWLWRTTHWTETEQRAIRAAAYEFTEYGVYQSGEDVKPWSPTSKKIGELSTRSPPSCTSPRTRQARRGSTAARPASSSPAPTGCSTSPPGS